MEGGMAVRAQSLSDVLDSGSQWKGLRESVQRFFWEQTWDMLRGPKNDIEIWRKGGCLILHRGLLCVTTVNRAIHSHGLERPWEDWWHAQLVWSSLEVRHIDKGILYCQKHCFKNTLRKRVWTETYLSLPWCDFRFYFHTFLYFADFLQWS